ncbi:DUF2840 domain-containing protein [Sphingopyxis macrogoltabida]|jgi:hypothetical protein|uniref:Glycosidase n=1 Tax=Sphingopyxis macrogoltabida TaxID=33050 RepID=A0AAC8YZF2_SPHMC|nr:DUF2840 domain-containing protein [Sphingopyxis macrogoltabida]ALJ13406.1 hypothetical protein LH19_11055 [Sphingopyxis macrogoltabida]AMU89130.1 hypothetical protein ATM17_08775 [Sphingopyxis macrogoltabida]
MQAAAPPPVGVRLPASGLTDVELTWIEGRLEQQLRFGRVAAERSGGPHKRIASFRPGATFGLIGCTADDLGCVFWSLAIVRAVAPGAPFSTHPAVRPGGEILLSLSNLEPIRAVCREIDMIEASGVDACDVSPDHWRHIGQRLAAALPFRSYSAERHAAWLRHNEARL